MYDRREFLVKASVGSGVTMLGGVGCAPSETIGTDAGSMPAASPFAPDGAVGSADGGSATCVQTEDNALGPAYLADAPFRSELNVLGWPGVLLVISGRVRGLNCEPVDGALLDVWQADDGGSYDGSPIDPDGDPAPRPEYPLRARLYCDSRGLYQFCLLRRICGYLLAPEVCQAGDRARIQGLPRF